ncbi:MAG: hypothetical protein ACOZIN_10195 [Myxococcota bacterium]
MAARICRPAGESSAGEGVFSSKARTLSEGSGAPVVTVFPEGPGPGCQPVGALEATGGPLAAVVVPESVLGSDDVAGTGGPPMRSGIWPKASPMG